MYKPAIGLEIHAELKTKSKMFCGCENGLGLEKEPNKHICPICTAQPGTLPVINKQAVENIIKIGLALKSEIQPNFKFFRKNYFYPDIPKGYQITSQEAPPAKGGYIELPSVDGYYSSSRQKVLHEGKKEATHKIRIHHIHLEEDTGKNIHPEGASYSLIDLNRAGVPLMELVTEPDIENGIEAKEFCQELQQILRTLEVSDADMEKGQMRCEVNISISKDEKLGVKVEIKNLNSFRAVERAIDYEIKRQTEILENGEKVIQETRGWDENNQKTFSQRSKEGAKDYRYFPEPDLPSIKINSKWTRKLECCLPELPQAKRKRFKEQYGFNNENAALLALDKKLANFTEQIISELKAWLLSLENIEGTEEEIWKNNKQQLINLVSGWLINKLSPFLQETGSDWSNLKITPENFAEFIILIYQNKISSAIGQEILKEMSLTGKDPSNIMEEKDLTQISGGSELNEIVDRAIKNNPEQVAQYKAGKEMVLQYLIGQVMKESKGKANPQTAGEMLREKLR
ncbi:MAG: Asp-tRNA(Asn)/Glu-tRNA(Gln) amidotransferase subunit GatB [bacterium]